MMAKVEVNGAQAQPAVPLAVRRGPGLLGSKGHQWNFTKFLVGKDGQVIRRYARKTRRQLADDVEPRSGVIPLPGKAPGSAPFGTRPCAV